jgi:hypothetical protein
MTITILPRFLLGRRDAILELAATHRTLLVGTLFVLSAGLARYYDQEDLVHEPWHLAIPFGVSVAASLVLFIIVYAGKFRRAIPGPPIVSAYLSFLGIFWMTAPLAWLYAVPYERFLSPTASLIANLVTLGIVAAWRVALMIRVLVVLMGYRPAPALFLVMAFGDAVLLEALRHLPVPILEFMGGIRSPRDRILADVALNTFCFAVCSAPIWLVGAFASLFMSRPSWQTLTPEMPAPRPAWPLYCSAAASVAIWAAILPFTQPDQQLWHQVERDFRDNKIDEAIATMSRHSRTSFPANWEPPPRVIREGDSAQISLFLKIMDALRRTKAAPWVRTVYVGRFRDYILRNPNWPDRHLIDVARIIANLPERDEILSDLERHQGVGDEYLKELQAEIDRQNSRK